MKIPNFLLCRRFSDQSGHVGRPDIGVKYETDQYDRVGNCNRCWRCWRPLGSRANNSCHRCCIRPCDRDSNNGCSCGRPSSRLDRADGSDYITKLLNRDASWISSFSGIWPASHSGAVLLRNVLVGPVLTKSVYKLSSRPQHEI